MCVSYEQFSKSPRRLLSHFLIDPSLSLSLIHRIFLCFSLFLLVRALPRPGSCRSEKHLATRLTLSPSLFLSLSHCCSRRAAFSKTPCLESLSSVVETVSGRDELSHSKPRHQNTNLTLFLGRNNIHPLLPPPQVSFIVWFCGSDDHLPLQLDQLYRIFHRYHHSIPAKCSSRRVEDAFL